MRDGGVKPIEVLVSSATLFVVAVVQPILDLLGDNPEFFVASDASRGEIIALALVAAVVVPLLVGLAVVGVRSLNVTAGTVLHLIVLTVLGGMLAVVVMGHTPLGSLPGVLQIALGLGVGAAAAAAFYKYEPIRSLLMFGGAAMAVVPVFFLLLSPTSRLVTGGAAVEVAGVAIEDPPPIVMVVFDEFPVASLIDADGNLQSDLYPNFQRLADDATWYRNAVTTHRLTQFAVPAALTGRTPPPEAIPIAFDHPDNLFTLLGGVYDVDAVESLTALCPAQVCEDSPLEAAPARQRWRAMAADMRIVAAHVLLPSDLTRSLPPIDQDWAGFGDAVAAAPIEPVAGFSDNANLRAIFRNEVSSGRRAAFEAFLDGIDPPQHRPGLDFAHVLVPHAPWEYLPSGQSYVPPSPIPGAEGNSWLSDPWPVSQAYQQHLLQVQFADALIGSLIDRMEEVGIYDDAILVVAADHGVVFRPDVENRRAATEESIGEIAAVPLFIKAPHQEEGAIDDYRAEIPDILPTVAAIIGLDYPWETEGTSLVAENRPVRETSTITGGGTVTFGAGGEEKLQAAARKMETFGDGGPFSLVPEGTGELLGAAVEEVPTGTSSLVTLDEPDLLGAVDPDADVLPLVVQGSVAVDEPTVLAVAVNDVVVAVTRSYQDLEGNQRFHALLPPDSLRAGDNELAVLLAEPDSGGWALTRVGP